MYKEFNLQSTHPRAEDILTDKKLKKSIDDYSRSVKKEFKEVWNKEKLENEAC